MVKGTNKRVVVVRSPNQKLFEQAIFIVSEHAGRKENSDSTILREAERVANDYLYGSAGSSRRFFQRLPPVAYAVLGALLTGAVWFVLWFFT